MEEKHYMFWIEIQGRILKITIENSYPILSSDEGSLN